MCGPVYPSVGDIHGFVPKYTSDINMSQGAQNLKIFSSGTGPLTHEERTPLLNQWHRRELSVRGDVLNPPASGWIQGTSRMVTARAELVRHLSRTIGRKTAEGVKAAVFIRFVGDKSPVVWLLDPSDHTLSLSLNDVRFSDVEHPPSTPPPPPPSIPSPATSPPTDDSEDSSVSSGSVSSGSVSSGSVSSVGSSPPRVRKARVGNPSKALVVHGLHLKEGQSVVWLCVSMFGDHFKTVSSKGKLSLERPHVGCVYVGPDSSQIIVGVTWPGNLQV